MTWIISGLIVIGILGLLVAFLQFESWVEEKYGFSIIETVGFILIIGLAFGFFVFMIHSLIFP